LPNQLVMLALVDPDARPPAVGDRCLGVEHHAVPLEDADTAIEQGAEAGAAHRRPTPKTSTVPARAGGRQRRRAMRQSGR
jgi:hypothetical protein